MELKRAPAKAIWRIYGGNQSDGGCNEPKRNNMERERSRFGVGRHAEQLGRPEDWLVRQQQNVRDQSINYRRQSQPPNYNDCEIIVVSKSLTKYAEMIESQLKQQGLSVDLLFPNNDVSCAKLLSNISSRGTLYAIEVTSQNEEQRTITLNILYGTPAEYHNMPIKDAMHLINTNFQQKLAYDKAGFTPPANPLQVLINVLANKRPLLRDTAIESEGNRKHRMSGSQRKRFKYFKRQGFSDEEAREKCTEALPWNMSDNLRSNELLGAAQYERDKVKAGSRENNRTEKRQLRMSGSQRKRYRYFKSKGFSDEEAREKSRVVVSERKGMIQKEMPCSHNRTDFNFSEAASPVKLGILPKGFSKDGGAWNLENGTEKRKFRMSGSQRKRYRYLKSNGFSDEEAREESRLVVAEREGGQKYKPCSHICPDINFSDSASLVKLGIIPKDFPKDQFTMENMREIEKAVLQKIAQGDNDTIKPAFTDLSFEQGYMVFTCKDRPTADWLKSFESDSIRVVEEQDLPRAQVMTGFFPNSKALTTGEILRKIQEQNEGVISTQWHVCKRLEEGDLSHLILSIDDNSIEELIRKNFWINYMDGSVSLVTTIFDGLSKI